VVPMSFESMPRLRLLQLDYLNEGDLSLPVKPYPAAAVSWEIWLIDIW
jgi:hypothetical protein